MAAGDPIMLEALDRWNDLLVCDSPESLRDACEQRFRELGFRHWAFSGANGPSVPSTLGNLPVEWLAHYARHGYFEIDPVVTHCRQRSTPCLWATDPAGHRFGHTTPYFREAADFGLRIGVGIPSHGPAGQWSMVTVARESLPGRALALDELARLHLLATFVHEARLRLSAEGATESVHLTQRESDTLRWAAEGKTSWEIGQLLGIGERTVVFHLGNAASKLGVVGRRQAVTRAIALQLIAI